MESWRSKDDLVLGCTLPKEDKILTANDKRAGSQRKCARWSTVVASEPYAFNNC